MAISKIQYTAGVILILNSLFFSCSCPDTNRENNRTEPLDTQVTENNKPHLIHQDTGISEEKSPTAELLGYTRTTNKASSPTPDKELRKDTTKKQAKTGGSDSISILIQTFQTKHGWGYDIFIDGKKYIHQVQIPSVPGIKGFKTQEHAQKTAELVAHKIRNNIIPPSVTPEEIEELGVWKAESE